MSILENIFISNKNWVTEKLKVDPEYFTKLSKGQNTEFLYIGCSDTRVTAEDLMCFMPRSIYSQKCCQSSGKHR